MSANLHPRGRRHYARLRPDLALRHQVALTADELVNVVRRLEDSGGKGELGVYYCTPEIPPRIVPRGAPPESGGRRADALTAAPVANLRQWILTQLRGF